MELELITLVYYGFGTAIILLFIYVTVLAAFFIRHLRIESKEEKSF